MTLPLICEVTPTSLLGLVRARIWPWKERRRVVILLFACLAFLRGGANITNTVRRSKSSFGRSAFTLIELLVTIAIIAVLAAIIVPAVGRAGFRSKVARCTNNMRQLGVACANYASEGQNILPSFPLPTRSMSNYHSISPTMVSFGTLSSLERFGVTPQMWFCPTRKRWDIYQTISRHARGHEIGSITDLINAYNYPVVSAVASLDMYWWVPRKFEGSDGLTYPNPKFSETRIPDGWPTKQSDANASVQPIASDWLLGSVDQESSGKFSLVSGGHSYGGKVVDSNSLFADGHVETRPFAALQWQMMSEDKQFGYFY
ncbi:MAG: prepilin-type N-terminal cleavage/methylation domain-containing protein [Verrucomicrobia bacterium]|nr:prepilin-type N-terminal cleavage/methylation domain-containing protein [Verrucomicrobiota bacterium]